MIDCVMVAPEQICYRVWWLQGLSTMHFTRFDQSGSTFVCGAKSSGSPPSEPLARIYLFDGLRALNARGESVLPGGRKARAMFAFLCLAPHGRASRLQIASMLWDRVPQAAAYASLRQAVRELAAALGPLASKLLTRSAGTIALNLEAC